MKIKELQTLLDQQPSVSANTLFVGILYVLAWILTLGFLILGLGLLLEGWFDWKLFLDWVSRQFGLILNEEQRSSISVSFGVFSLILGVVFGGVIYLCRWILQRNHFIIQMEDWVYNNLTDIKKISKKTLKK